MDNTPPTQNPAAEEPFALTREFHEWLKSLGLQCVRIDAAAIQGGDGQTTETSGVTPGTDSAVNEAAYVIADHSRRAPNAPLSEEWIRLTIRYAIQEAIARDRAERDAELERLKQLVSERTEAANDFEQKTIAQSAELLALLARHESLQHLVTTDHESKQAFIQRVRAALNSPTQKSPAK